MESTTLLARRGGPLKQLWRSYERQLKRRPLMIQMATTGCLWAGGDALAQRYAERNPRLDVRRLALTGLFGGTVVGPLGHWWYSSLDALCSRFGAPGSAAFLLGKLLVDNVVYNSLNITAFFAFGSGVLDGEGPQAFMNKMRQEFLPTFAAEASVWPPYMALIFTKVPLHHQLLAVNVGTIFDVCFLSWARNQEGGLMTALAKACAPERRGQDAALHVATKSRQLDPHHPQHRKSLNSVSSVRRGGAAGAHGRHGKAAGAPQQQSSRGAGAEGRAVGGRMCEDGVGETVSVVNIYCCGLDAVSCTAVQAE